MSNLDPFSFVGCRIIESALLTVAGAPVTVRRTWRERLLSRPWRPWVRTRTFIPQVPHPGAVRIAGDTLVMHPVTLREFRRLTQGS